MVEFAENGRLCSKDESYWYYIYYALIEFIVVLTRENRLIYSI